MQLSQKDIEKSAKTIFRIYFGSKLLENKYCGLFPDFWSVDLLMECGGKKKLSICFNEKTVKLLTEKITGNYDITDVSVFHNIISEMATLIAGNALSENYEHFSVSNPVISKNHNTLKPGAKAYSSILGDIAISIEDLQTAN